MKVLQINSIVNSGSTGRIAEDIGKVLIINGHESFIAYGRGNRPSESNLVKIGNKFDFYSHVIQTRLFDNHGFASTRATMKLIKEIENIKPDVIGLHNLHGYYINIKILFDYLNSRQIPVLWTLFDCWAFTGHCSYFDDIHCEKWHTQCYKCPKYKNYPTAWIDNSKKNYLYKKELFTKNNNLQILVHSKWLADLVQKSFLGEIPIHITPSAIDINTFKPTTSLLPEKYGILEKKIILGCANIWTERKGLSDIVKLNELLPNNYCFVVIGVNKEQISKLSENIIGIERTENISQLAEWYSVADVFINPTYQDNFPTTNIEALACGTPVITYNTGGSPEAIDEKTGIVVEKGNIEALLFAINTILEKGEEFYSLKCRERALKLFNKDDRYLDYLKIYQSLV